MDQQEMIAQMLQMQQNVNASVQTIVQQMQSGNTSGEQGAPVNLPEKQTLQVQEMMAIMADAREKLLLIAANQNEGMQ